MSTLLRLNHLSHGGGCGCKIAPSVLEEILTDTPFGKGLQSIFRETGSTRFPRIRIGIGPLPDGRDAADFVLSPFSRTEKSELAAALDNAREALLMILTGDIERAMNSYNTK